MEREQIIRMAKEAGMREGESGDWTAADATLTYPECVYTENLERFASLVAAAEREACAYRAGIALLGADRGLANRVDYAIRERGAS